MKEDTIERQKAWDPVNTTLDQKIESIPEAKRVETFYNSRWYDVDKELLDRLKVLKPWRPILAAINAWFWIFLIVKTFLYVPQLAWGYPIVLFFIAGRMGVFLQLAHEAAHGLISKGRFNEWFGNWVASYPIGLDLKGYEEPHLRHHACTNKGCDSLTDSEKYTVCDIKKPKLWFLFLKDLLGITAITVRFRYGQLIANHNKDIDEYSENEEDLSANRFSHDSLPQTVRKYLSIGFVQLFILGILFRFNLLHYLLLWILPLVTAHMVLMRVRGIAEHGLGIQLGIQDLGEKNRGTFYTRSFGTLANRYRVPFLNLLERWLIGSLNVYYHHEHHLYPKIPYYNLPKVHKMVSKQIRQYNPHVFAKGYFDCLFFTLRNNTPSASASN